jgi:hypothetical protein
MATYIVAIDVAAICLLAYTISGFPRDHYLDLAMFLVAAAAGERWAVAASAEGLMSLSLTVSFAAAILFGPAFAGIVAVGGIVITDLIISRRRAAPSCTSGRHRSATWGSSTCRWRRSARCWRSPARTAAGTSSTSRS